MRRARTTLATVIAICLLAGSAVGVAAQDEPVEVAGQVTFSGPSGSVETWATNDLRLTGTGTWDPTEGTPMDSAPDFWLMGRFLETDDGTWRQLPVPVANIAGWRTTPTSTLVLVGEEGYAGLAYIAQATWTENGFDVHGYIVDAEAS